MMITPAAAFAADCHSGTAKALATHVEQAHGHAGAAVPDDWLPSTDDGMPTATSNCPLANIASIATPAPNFTRVPRAMRLSAHESRALVSAVLDLPDPPPRETA